MRGWFRDGRGAPSSTTENSSDSSRRASSPTAIERRTSRDSVEPRSFSWAATDWIARSSSRASAMSSSPWTARVPSKELHLAGLDREVPAVGVFEAAGLGFGGHVAADRLVHQPVQLDGADPVRGRRHVPIHKPRRIHGQQEGLLGDPPAPATAANDRTAPAATLAAAGSGVRGRGRRTASPHPSKSRERRRTRSTENSATHGAPSPATGIPASPYAPAARVSASRIESTECIAAHCTAASRRSASAWSASARLVRAKSSTAGAVSNWSSASVVMRSTQAPTTDSPRPRSPWLSGSVERTFRTATTAVTEGTDRDPGAAAMASATNDGEQPHQSKNSVTTHPP